MGALSEENKKALEALSLEAYTWEEFLAKVRRTPAPSMALIVTVPLQPKLCDTLHMAAKSGFLDSG